MKRGRLKRLLELLIQRQGGLPQTTSSLASTLCVSRRTIFRDLEVWRDAGVPLVFDDDQLRYDLATAGILPPTSFTTSEALSLIRRGDCAGSFAKSARRPCLGGGAPRDLLAGSSAVRCRDQLPW